MTAIVGDLSVTTDVRNYHVLLSPCRPDGWQAAELKRLAGGCRSVGTVFVEKVDEADIVLITDLDYDDEADVVFSSFLRNPLWRAYPEKCFVLTECDDPPSYLHGIHASARRSQSRFGRFASCAYPFHRRVYDLPPPAPEALPGHEKDLLFSFAGRPTHRVRRRLCRMKFPDCVLQETDAGALSKTGSAEKCASRQRFWDLMQRSKYALCPRGRGSSSVRLFESLELGVAPVIIADDWIPCRGPNWDDFAIFVREKDIRRIHSIVKEHESEYVERGRKARLAHEQFFAENTYWAFLIETVNYIRSIQSIPERAVTSLWRCQMLMEWARRRRMYLQAHLKGKVKRLISSRSGRS